MVALSLTVAICQAGLLGGLVGGYTAIDGDSKEVKNSLLSLFDQKNSDSLPLASDQDSLCLFLTRLAIIYVLFLLSFSSHYCGVLFTVSPFFHLAFLSTSFLLLLSAPSILGSHADLPTMSVAELTFVIAFSTAMLSLLNQFFLCRF